MDTVKCEQCGTEIPRTTRFCPECGHANAAALTETALTGSSEREIPNPGYSSTMMAARTDPVQQSLGAPTVNISSTPAPVSQGQPTQYVPSIQSPAPGYAQTQNFAQPQQQYPSQYPSAQPYTGYTQNPMGYQYQSQVGVAGVTPKDSTAALLLELIGYIGFLGIGHMYANRVPRGIALMIGWWIYWGMTTLFFVTILLSLLACLMCVVGLLIPILSGVWIKMDLDKEKAYARPRY